MLWRAVMSSTLATMSFLPDRIIVLGILCCIFLLTNEVQCKRRSSSSTSSSTSSNPKVTTSTETVRLVDGSKRCKGLLQVKSSDSWHSVCSTSFTALNAFVTCGDFECGFPIRHYGHLNSGYPNSGYPNSGYPNSGYPTRLSEDDSWSAVFNCSGQEQHLVDCPNAPLESDRECRPTFLECSEKPKSPDVNVYSLERSGFDHDHVSVYAGHSYVIICRIDSPFKVHSFVLGVLISSSNTSKWTQPAVDNAAHFFLPLQPPIEHNGFSYSCQYNFEFKPETFSYSDYRVITFMEPSYVRLVGGESRCLGNLELQHEEEWRAVSQQLWGQTEGAVVCRQLDCGHVISTDTPSRELQPVWRFFSDCDGSERALLSCGSVREGKSASNVHVLCSDILHPANISVAAEKTSTGVNSTVVYSPYSFYINCSVLPQFPGGQFSLVFTGVKHSLTLNQIAANHSAVFTFALSEKAHSGNYRCIYHNSVYGHSFSSQSKEISIAVEDAEDVLLDDGVARDSGSTVCSGTLLVKDRSQTMMVTAHTENWDMKHAAVVCRQLGCGSAFSTSIVEIPPVRPMWRFFSDCDGSEAALLQCGHVQKWFASNAIKVVCKG